MTFPGFTSTATAWRAPGEMVAEAPPKPREIGTIFRAESVRGLLNLQPGAGPPGALDPDLPFKWQTRRRVNLKGRKYDGHRPAGHADSGDVFCSFPAEPTGCARVRCRWHVGDRVWVREAYAERFRDVSNAMGDGLEQEHDGWMYQADELPAWRRRQAGEVCAPMWQSPFYMRKAAARIWLEVAEVRVQRVQDITEDDAKAEGLDRWTKDGRLWKWGIADRDGSPGTDDSGMPWQDWNVDPRLAYGAAWDRIHGDGAWARNDYVWAISFRRLS